MRRRGAKSFVDDLSLSRGVVLSRAELFCDLLRLSPLTRRFVRFRRTYLLLLLLLCETLMSTNEFTLFSLFIFVRNFYERICFVVSILVHFYKRNLLCRFFEFFAFLQTNLHFYKRILLFSAFFDCGFFRAPWDKSMGEHPPYFRKPKSLNHRPRVRTRGKQRRRRTRNERHSAAAVHP